MISHMRDKQNICCQTTFTYFFFLYFISFFFFVSESAGSVNIFGGIDGKLTMCFFLAFFDFLFSVWTRFFFYIYIYILAELSWELFYLYAPFFRFSRSEIGSRICLSIYWCWYKVHSRFLFFFSFSLWLFFAFFFLKFTMHVAYTQFLTKLDLYSIWPHTQRWNKQKKK